MSFGIETSLRCRAKYAAPVVGDSGISADG